eukprot:13696_1
MQTPTSVSDNVTKVHFDLSIFKEELDVNNGQCDSSDYLSCKSIRRLSSSLRYYSSLDITNNKLDQNIFIDFILGCYNETLLDDFIHLSKKHQHQLEDINIGLMQNYKFDTCDIKHCQYTSRHYRSSSTENNNMDSTVNFYRNVMDTLHFFLFHLSDSGLRTNDIDYDKKHQDKENSVNLYFDTAFAKMSDIIGQRKHLTKSFERFKVGTNDKYNIQVDDNKSSDNDTTYLDAMYKYLSFTGIESHTIKKLKALVTEHEYDSDSIQVAIETGNVFDDIDEKQSADMQSAFSVMKFAFACTSQFSIGLRFYYWDSYKYMNKLPVDDPNEMNFNDHSGHEVFELYVKQKYSSFKVEILSSGYINIGIYDKNVITKALHYQVTKMAKSMKHRYLEPGRTYKK